MVAEGMFSRSSYFVLAVFLDVSMVFNEAAAPDFCFEVGFQSVYYIKKVSFQEESKEKKMREKQTIGNDK